MSDKAAGNGNGNGVTWKWMTATLAGVLVLGAAGWMTAMERRQQGIEADQKAETKERTKQGGDIEVIKERLRTMDRDLQETKEATKESNKKLDELLRRR